MSPKRNTRSAGFSVPLSVSTKSKPSLSRSKTSTTPIAQITTVSDRQLTDLLSSTTKSSIVVVKCFASYCGGCRGVEPKFRKIAAAYDEAKEPEQGRPDVHFCQMDYARNEQFCKNTLGVRSLPFFGIWKDGQYVGGEAIGWQSVSKRLVEKIESFVDTAIPDSR